VHTGDLVCMRNSSTTAMLEEQAGDSGATPESPADPALFEDAEHEGAYEYASEEPEEPEETDVAPEAIAAATFAARMPRTKPRTPNTEPRQMPEHLESLCDLPGVNRHEFESIDCRRAWILAISNCKHRKRGNVECLPLGHLAPDAVDTMRELGLHGHVRFSVYESEREANQAKRGEEITPVFYGACKLPEPPESAEKGAREAETEALLAIEESLAERMELLREEVRQAREQAAPINPLHQVKELLGFVRESIREFGEIKAELGDIAGEHLDDLGGDADDGGTTEALLAVAGEKIGEALKSDGARKFGGMIYRALARQFGEGGEGGGDA
jgi:hypothetical protein